MHNDNSVTTNHTYYLKPEDVTNAISEASGSILLYLVSGTDDDKRVDTVMGAEVSMEKGIRSLYLYLTLDDEGNRILLEHMDNFAAHLRRYMENPNSGNEPVLMISCVPPQYGGDWFLGCSDPDAYFPIADKLGDTADRICLVFNEESVGVFESNSSGKEAVKKGIEERTEMQEVERFEE